MSQPAVARVRAARRTSIPESLRQLAAPTRAVPGWVYRVFGITDLLMAYASLVAAFVVMNFADVSRDVTGFWETRIRLVNLLAVLVLGLVWGRTFTAFGLYRQPKSALGELDEFRRLVLACSVGALPSLVFPLLSRSGAFGFAAALLFWAISIPAVAGTRVLVRWVAYSVSDLRRRQILIVGSGPRAQKLQRELARSNGLGPKLLGFVDTNGGISDPGVARGSARRTGRPGADPDDPCG